VKTWEWIAIGAGGGALAVLILVLLAALVTRRRRRSRLRQRFGPEYYRAVSSTGKRRAERRLADVAREHESLPIRGLPWVALERYLEEWRQVEGRFVNDPPDAARSAERIVLRVMEDRGYPTTGDTEEQATHIAADHPAIADRYRHAEELLAAGNGSHSTENLRRAVVDLRAVLEGLLMQESSDTRQEVPA